jgi:hypothetical protein
MKGSAINQTQKDLFRPLLRDFHLYNLGDETLVLAWIVNPHRQYFFSTNFLATLRILSIFANG